MLFGLGITEEHRIELSIFFAMGKIFDEFLINSKNINQRDPQYEDSQIYLNNFFKSMFENGKNNDEKIEILKELSYYSIIHCYKIALNTKCNTMRVIELTNEYLLRIMDTKKLIEKYFCPQKKPDEIISFILPQGYDMNCLSLFTSFIEINNEKFLLKGILCVKGKIATYIVKNTHNMEWKFKHGPKRDDINLKKLSNSLEMAVENGYTPISYFYMQHDLKNVSKELITYDTTNYLNKLIQRNKQKQVKINHQSCFKDLVTDQLIEQKVNFIEFIPQLSNREYQSTLLSSLPSRARSPYSLGRVNKNESNKSDIMVADSKLLVEKFNSDKEKQKLILTEKSSDSFYSGKSKPILQSPNPQISPSYENKHVPYVKSPKFQNENPFINNRPVFKPAIDNDEVAQIIRKSSYEGAGSPIGLIPNPEIKQTSHNEKPQAKNELLPKNGLNQNKNGFSPPKLNVFNPGNNMNNKKPHNLNPTPINTPFEALKISDPNFSIQPKMNNFEPKIFKPTNINIAQKMSDFDPQNIAKFPNLGSPPPLLGLGSQNIAMPSNLGSPPPLLGLGSQYIPKPPDLGSPPPLLGLGSQNIAMPSNLGSPPPLLGLDPQNIVNPPDLGSPPQLYDDNYIDKSQVPSQNFNGSEYVQQSPPLLTKFMSNPSSNPLINQEISMVSPKSEIENQNFYMQTNLDLQKHQFFNSIIGEYEKSNIPPHIIPDTISSDFESQYGKLETFNLYSSHNVKDYHNLNIPTDWTCYKCKNSIPQDTIICSYCNQIFLCPYCSNQVEYYNPNCNSCGNPIYYNQ